MNPALLLAAQYPEGVEPAADTSIFNVALGVSFWTVIIFLVLAFILAKWAFPPILGYATAREERIQAALDEAQRQREETARLLEEQRAQLAEAKQQALAVIAEGKVAADRARDELVNRARAEQQEIIERARKEIAHEREKALESLRREAVDIAMAAAAKLVGERLQADDDRRIVQEYLASVETTGRTGAGVA
jgi:F-type H+-transporting ATPase subunit b